MLPVGTDEAWPVLVEATAPTFSIVVAVRNGATTLSRCIESVLGQDCGSVDLVIIDGGSTDESVNIIRGHAARLGYWVSEPDRGVYDAWNKAIDHVRGDWLCFLGADDHLADSAALSRVAARLAGRPERVAYGVVHAEDDTGRLRHVFGEPWSVAKPALSRRMSLPNPGTFYSRELFAAHGRFDVRFAIAGDYEFLLRELTHGDAYFVDTLVTIMGTGGMSFDPRSRPQSLREAARARRIHGLETRPDWRLFEIYEAYGYAWLTRLVGARRSARVWGVYQSRIKHRLNASG